MSAEAERSQRLKRVAQAFESRRGVAAARLRAIEGEMAEAQTRVVEMIEWMAIMAGEPRILLAATHRLADLQATQRQLEAEREKTQRDMTRDKRAATGAERVAARFALLARRKEEQASLEAYVDATFGRPKPR